MIGLRKHDVAFLITLRPPNAIGTNYDPYSPFIPQVGLCYVRGCEIEGMLDDEGKVIEEGRRIFCLSFNSFALADAFNSSAADAF